MYVKETFLRTYKPPLSLMLSCEIFNFLKTTILKKHAETVASVLPVLLSSANLISCY